MTNIFQLKSDVEHFQWLTLPREEEFDILHDLGGAPMAANWRALAVESIRDESDQEMPHSDFPTLGSTPVLSERAVHALSDILATRGELLPLDSETGRYYIFNVTRVIEALDEERSELVRFSDGGVMRVSRFAFKPDAVREEVIFKISQLRSAVFVSDLFVDRVRNAALTGFEFRNVWSSS